MAVVQRVILLNKPLKIRGYSILQWVLGVFAVAIAFGLASYTPKEWKVGNLPAGVLIFVVVVGAAITLIHAAELKPLIWWQNQLLYRLGVKPTKFLPHLEAAQEYPDSSIIEPVKQKDKYYVQRESGKK